MQQWDLSVINNVSKKVCSKEDVTSGHEASVVVFGDLLVLYKVTFYTVKLIEPFSLGLADQRAFFSDFTYNSGLVCLQGWKCTCSEGVWQNRGTGRHLGPRGWCRERMGRKHLLRLFFLNQTWEVLNPFLYSTWQAYFSYKQTLPPYNDCTIYIFIYSLVCISDW